MYENSSSAPQNLLDQFNFVSKNLDFHLKFPKISSKFLLKMSLTHVFVSRVL